MGSCNVHEMQYRIHTKFPPQNIQGIDVQEARWKGSVDGMFTLCITKICCIHPSVSSLMDITEQLVIPLLRRLIARLIIQHSPEQT